MPNTLEKSPITVAVTGAAGQISYSLLFRIAAGALFGWDQPVNLRLIEVEGAMNALEGVVMELDDCAFPLLNSIEYTSYLDKGFAGADWSILVGSVPRKAGMERKDLLNINGRIFIGQGEAIQKNAAPNSRVLVVGNPCNTNCLIGMKAAQKVSGSKDEKEAVSKRWFAMTRLDENRAKRMLVDRYEEQHKTSTDNSPRILPVTAVKKLAIWGNHSSTMYPDFYHAELHHKDLPDGQIPVAGELDKVWLTNDFITSVQQRGAAIIKQRGLSSAASAANAIANTVRSLTCGTLREDWATQKQPDGWSYGKSAQDVWTSVGVPLPEHDPYNIGGGHEGLIFSFPVVTVPAAEPGKDVVDANRVTRIVEGIEHDEFSRKKIEATAAELLEEREAVKELLV